MIVQSHALAPFQPEGLKATSMAASRIDLRWTDRSSGETSFRVYRKRGAGAWTLIKTTSQNIQAYSDTSATGNDSTLSHSYFVQACNNYFCLSTGIAAVPFAPTGVSAIPFPRQIDLSWTDTSANETGFEIYMKEGACSSAGAFRLIDTAPADEEAYSISGLDPSTPYSFKVRAVKKSATQPVTYGYSKYPACVEAVTP